MIKQSKFKEFFFKIGLIRRKTCPICGYSVGRTREGGNSLTCETFLCPFNDEDQR